MSRLNRTGVRLRKQKNPLRKRLRKCLLNKAPDVILQHIVCFLEQKDVTNLQKTCSYFRLRYLAFEKQVGIKANVSKLAIKNDVLLQALPIKSEYLTNLNLDFANLKNYKLPPLSAKIRSLSLYYSIITNVSMLSGNTTLQYLNISGCPVQNVYSLKDATGLRHVNLSRTNVKDLSPIAHVRSIYISETHVDDVSMLRDVVILNASYTGVTDVSMLNKVKILSIEACRIKNIGALEQLKQLNLSYVDIGKNLTMIKGCKRLTALDLSRSIVDDISEIGTFTSLRKIDLHTTEVKKIDALAECKMLTSVDLQYTNVEDVRMLGKVQYLNVSDSNVVDVSPLTDVKILKAAGIRITGITKLRQIKILHISHLSQTDAKILSRRKSIRTIYLYKLSSSAKDKFDDWTKIGYEENYASLNIIFKYKPNKIVRKKHRQNR